MTHQTIAVALDHDPAAEDVPAKVVASGRGKLAENILDLAFAHGVKVRQDQDLAEVLAAVDVDAEIPMEAFAAVADILEYLYQANDEVPA